MSHYGPPQDPGQPYWQSPGQPYGGGPYPQPPAPQSPFTGVAANFGARLFRRPEPRFTVALAAAGAALTLLGVLIWSSDYYSSATSASTSRNLLGAGLGALVTVLGYVLMVRRRTGPAASAGSLAAGIGLPVTIAFLSLDAGSSGSPINFDATFWASAVVWLVSYLFVPGARGRTFFVFLLSGGLVAYALIKNATNVGVDFIFSPTSLGPRFHGLGTIAAIGLVFGLGYYLLAFLFDHTGRHGPATGFVFPAFVATGVGLLAWSPTLHEAGTGIMTVALGAVVCWYGGRFGRRATCFAAAAAIAVGVLLVVEDASPNNSTAAGITFIVVGVLVVAAATALAAAAGERDDMDPEAIVRAR